MKKLSAGCLVLGVAMVMSFSEPKDVQGYSDKSL